MDKIKKLEDKIDYLTTLFEEHILTKEDVSTNNQKEIVAILEKTPLAQHPIFKSIIDTFKSQTGENK